MMSMHVSPEGVGELWLDQVVACDDREALERVCTCDNVSVADHCPLDGEELLRYFRCRTIPRSL